MLLGFVECREEDGHALGHVVADKRQDILVVPVVESALGNLMKNSKQATYKYTAFARVRLRTREGSA